MGIRKSRESRNLKVMVNIVPTSGEPQVKEVEVPRGSKIELVAQLAGVANPTSRNIKLGVAPATTETPIEKEGRVVTFTERPQGS